MLPIGSSFLTHSADELMPIPSHTTEWQRGCLDEAVTRLAARVGEATLNKLTEAATRTDGSRNGTFCWRAVNFLLSKVLASLTGC